MPERPKIEYLLNRSPEEIVNWFTDKGFAVSWNWRDVWKDAHKRAFTVAKATNLEVLDTIRSSVEEALEEGTTLRQFQKNLEPELKKLGWWGKQQVIDEATGEILEVQLGSPWRLKTIYRTNLQTSYMHGRYQNQIQASGRRPWWAYDAVNDSNTRPSHAEKDGVIKRSDDPFWDTHYPPNGWGCRCIVRTLSDRQLDRRGLTPTEGDIEPFAGEGWDYNPGKTLEWEPDLGKYPDDLAEAFEKVQSQYTPIETEES